MAAIAQIEQINFPTYLNPGDLITGSITIKNIGDETTSAEAGYFGVLIKTISDGQEHTLFTYSTTAPGETVTFDFHALIGGIGTMPDINAELEVVGRVWLAENWRVDDVKSWIITLPTEPPTQEPKPLLPLLIIAGLILLLPKK